MRQPAGGRVTQLQQYSDKSGPGGGPVVRSRVHVPGWCTGVRVRVRDGRLLKPMGGGLAVCLPPGELWTWARAGGVEMGVIFHPDGGVVQFSSGSRILLSSYFFRQFVNSTTPLRVLLYYFFQKSPVEIGVGKSPVEMKVLLGTDSEKCNLSRRVTDKAAA